MDTQTKIPIFYSLSHFQLWIWIFIFCHSIIFCNFQLWILRQVLCNARISHLKLLVGTGYDVHYFQHFSQEGGGHWRSQGVALGAVAPWWFSNIMQNQPILGFLEVTRPPGFPPGSPRRSAAPSSVPSWLHPWRVFSETKPVTVIDFIDLLVYFLITPTTVTCDRKMILQTSLLTSAMCCRLGRILLP